MMRLMRYRLALLLAIWAVWLPRAQAAAPAKATPQADQLRQEADALLASVVKRPYGWGWSTAVPDEPAPAAKGKPAFVPIATGPCETPTAGLVLYWTSQLLHDAKYADAARQIARGVAASQLPSGRFPNPANFGLTSAAGKDLVSPLPDRAPTRAAMALLLSLADDGDKQPAAEAINRAGSRAAASLLKTQADSGAWPILYPPGAEVKDAKRIVRLDTPETRDCVLAMLLAYETQGDVFQRRSVERTLEWLLKARSGAALPIGGALWQPAYTPVAVPVDRMPEFPNSYDLLASRYAGQTFLAVYTILGEGPRLTVAELALRSMDDLVKGDDGHWHPRYNFKGVALDNLEPAPATPDTPLFAEPKKPQPPPADSGLAVLSETVATARQLGRDKFRERISAGFSPRQHLAIVLSGLGDDPMAAAWPTDPVQLEAYFKRLESSPHEGADLSGKVRRLWGCYLLARSERNAER